MSGVIKQTRVETSGEAQRYILIPKYETALPLSGTPESQIAQFLVSKADYELPQNVEDFPIISSYLLHLHFPAYAIVERMITIETVTPVRVMTWSERESHKQRVTEAHKRDAAERKQADLRARAVHVDMSLFID